MKRNLLILVFALFGSAVMAQTTWEPSGFEGSDGLWINPGNWTDGLPGDTETKTVFSIAGEMDCIVDENVGDGVDSAQIVMGDGGPGGTLQIVDGGVLNLTHDTWSAIGYNDDAKMIVETGGEVTFGSHMWIGFETGAENCEVHVNGGTINVDGMFGMDWLQKENPALLVMNDGLLNLSTIHDGGDSMGPNSEIQYEGGLIQISGDHEDVLNDFYVDKIVGEYEIVVDSSDTENKMTYLGNDVPTSINPSVQVEKATVSPNPADDYLNVSLGNDVIQSVQIIDLSGRVADSFEYGNVKEATIQLEGIAKGIYIVKVKGKESSDFEKVIIR